MQDYKFSAKPFPFRTLRVLAVVLATSGTTLAMAIDDGMTASAAGCVTAVSVPESAASVDTSTIVQPGDSISVTGSGSIWSGVWLTGSNGPEGTTTAASSGFPLPGARRFSLLARLGSGWIHIGRGGTITNNSLSPARLRLRTNDDVPGNGSGSFIATYSSCVKDAGTYILAGHSGQCLAVAWASTAPGADVVQATCTWKRHEIWSLRPTRDGFYEVIAAHSGQCLDVAGSSKLHAADVVQNVCSGAASQQWRKATVTTPPYTGESPWYQYVNRNSGMCLAVAWGSTAHGANVLQATCVQALYYSWMRYTGIN